MEEEEGKKRDKDGEASSALQPALHSLPQSFIVCVLNLLAIASSSCARRWPPRGSAWVVLQLEGGEDSMDPCLHELSPSSPPH